MVARSLSTRTSRYVLAVDVAPIDDDAVGLRNFIAIILFTNKHNHNPEPFMTFSLFFTGG